MRSSIVVFPGSNCDREVKVALAKYTGQTPAMVWHKDSELPPSDLIVLPGGFSYGDYLRGGAIAALSPIMHEVRQAAKRGVYVLGICNGFQVLTEAGLLPGGFLINDGLRFVCRPVYLRVENKLHFTSGLRPNEVLQMPIAHGKGNYFAYPSTLKRLKDQGRIAFRYCTADGIPNLDANPNGSTYNIAGVIDSRHRILGIMPHPERAVELATGSADGGRFFEALVGSL